MYKLWNKINILFAIGVITTLGSCGTSDPDSPGLEYMPDMYRSPAIEVYVDYGEIRGRERTELKSKLSAMIPPKNTIPYIKGDSAKIRLMMPFLKPTSSMRETHGLFDWDVTNEDTYLAAIGIDNAIKMTTKNKTELLERGKTLYSSMCQHCHGEAGDGNGPMVVSGAYKSAGNLNYKDEAKMALSDGQMFYSISYGKNNMGAHAPLLSKEEIWVLVHYVRSLQYGDGYNGTVKPTASVDPLPNAVATKDTKKKGKK
ncbi:MAG: hypothetical protein RL037_1612 [Bacteroidota bacterium]|jgi:cytochrome c